MLNNNINNAKASENSLLVKSHYFLNDRILSHISYQIFDYFIVHI